MSAIPGVNDNSSNEQLLQAITRSSLNRTIPQPVPINPSINQTVQGFLDRSNDSTGLTDTAKTALTGEATAGLQSRYENAAQNLRTTLLQRGMYGGAMPANAGELLRNFGPLQSSLADAQSAAGRQTILADEQAKRESLLANRNAAAAAVGMGTNIWADQNKANLDSFTAGSQSIDEAIKAAGLAGDLEKTSTKNIITASLLGAGSKILTDPKMLTTIGHALGIGGAAATTGGTTAATVGAAGLPAGITAAGGTGAAAGLPTAAPALAGGASGSGLGASLGAFFTNPITIGVGAAIAAAIIWKHKQVHPTAAKFVDEYQNPFGQHLSEIVNQFDQAYAAGGMDKTTAQAARDHVASLIHGFESDIEQFDAKGGKEHTVAQQAKATMTRYFGQNWEGVLGKMDQEIAALRG